MLNHVRSVMGWSAQIYGHIKPNLMIKKNYFCLELKSLKLTLLLGEDSAIVRHLSEITSTIFN